MRSNLERYSQVRLRLAFLMVCAGLVNCDEVVGPVPEYDYEFNNFTVSLDTLDLSSLSADPLVFTAGDVANAAASSLSGEIGTNAATTTSLVTAGNNVLDAGQQTYWGGMTTTSILNGISTGDAAFTTQYNAMLVDFQTNGTLSAYVPATTQPSINTGARISNANSNANTTKTTNSLRVSGDDLDDCRTAANDAYNEAIAELDSLRDIQIALIDSIYQAETSQLDASVTQELTDAATRHDSRITLFTTLFTNIDGSITSALSNGQITAGEAAILRILNIAIFALNANFSFILLSQEQQMIADFLTSEQGNLDQERNNLFSQLNASYNTQAAALQSQLTTSIGACHNQGINSGT